MPDRSLQVPRLRVENPEIVVRLERGRVERQDLQVCGDGVLTPVLLLQDPAERALDRGPCRIYA